MSQFYAPKYQSLNVWMGMLYKYPYALLKIQATESFTSKEKNQELH